MHPLNKKLERSSYRETILVIASFLSLGMMSCAPTVKLTTPEPLKVNIKMDVNVYQRELVTKQQRRLSEEELNATRRKDERNGEIWTMKNDGVAVETPNGYLEARPKSGWDPKYIAKLITEENLDRRVLYEGEARDNSRPLSVIEIEAGKRLQQQAYVTPSTATPTNVIQSVPAPQSVQPTPVQPLNK